MSDHFALKAPIRRGLHSQRTQVAVQEVDRLNTFHAPQIHRDPDGEGRIWRGEDGPGYACTSALSGHGGFGAPASAQPRTASPGSEPVPTPETLRLLTYGR